jgi:hypothetical protein
LPRRPDRFGASAPRCSSWLGPSAAGTLAFAPGRQLDFGFNALGEAKSLAATLKNGTAAGIAHQCPATLADNPGGYALVSTTCRRDRLAAGQPCTTAAAYTAKDAASPPRPGWSSPRWTRPSLLKLR